MFLIEEERNMADQKQNNSNGISAVVPDLQETMCMLQMMSTDGPLAELKPKPALSGISMPGIANIFGDAHLTRRSIWILVIVSAFAIAIIQVKLL